MTEQLLDEATERRHLRALPGRDDLDEPGAEEPEPAPPAPETTTGADKEHGPVRVDPPQGDRPVIQSVRWRPVMPAWLRDRSEFTHAGRWAAAHAGHTTAYHAVRTPKYAGQLAARSPRGAGRLVRATLRWVFDAEGEPVRAAAVRAADAKEYMRLLDRRNDRVRLRVIIACGVGAAAIAAVSVLAAATGPAVHWTALVGLVMVLGLAGAPEDKPLVEGAVVKQHAQRLTSTAVLRALGALGIGEINRAMKRDGEGVTFPAPITRDGPGWRADIDLPPGVTAAHIMDKRYELASGLRRPVGCVWPEPDHDQHAGRLVLWVGDHDMNKARQPAWPLFKGGKTSVFQPLPFGTDQRGRPIDLTLIFNSVLIGAMPRQGKTFSLRVLLLGVSLDVHTEMRTFELKGTGDLEPLAKVSHHYGSGAGDDTVEACLASLREVEKNLQRRSRTIAGLPKDVCPENKVTADLSAKKNLRLHPLVFTIDECQELFTHPEYGKEAARLAERVIKLGPAMGIILVLATQRPDSKSLPTGVSANAGIRFCLRVMGQVENDMVLGTSMYQNGVRATTFTAKDKGIGYLIGNADDPQLARSYYLDGPTAERVTDRAQAARRAAGTLSGYALGEEPDTPSYSLLDDVAAVFPAGEDKLWSETIVERLADLRPDAYSGWEPGQLSSGLKPHGVATRQVSGYTHDGERRNRYGVIAQHVTDAITRRDQSEGDPRPVADL